MTTVSPRSVAVSLTFDRGQDRAVHDLDGVAARVADHLAELAVHEDPVVELAAPAVEVGVADQPVRPAGTPPGTSSRRRPRTQCRARAPSMTSTPRSSAVARLTAASAVSSTCRSTLSGSTASGAAVAHGWPGLWTQASGAEPDRRRRRRAGGRSRRRRSSGSRVSSRTPPRSIEPIERRSTDAVERLVRVAVGPAASGPSQSGGWPLGSVGPKRDGRRHGLADRQRVRERRAGEDRRRTAP